MTPLGAPLPVPHFQHGLCLYFTHLYTCTPTLGLGGPPHCCTPVWGQQGHTGSPRVARWGLSGHLGLVGHQCCPYWWQTQSALQLLGDQRRCLLPRPGDPPTALPLYPPSLLPISVMVQQNCLHPMGALSPADPQGVLVHLPVPLGMQRGLGGSWHLLACWEGGSLGFFGISTHVEGRLLGSWHLQHVREDIGVLQHLQACGRS